MTEILNQELKGILCGGINLSHLILEALPTIFFFSNFLKVISVSMPERTKVNIYESNDTGEAFAFL